MIEMNNESLASIFKATRKFYGLQQTEFSKQLGVTQGTISKIESAIMAPDLGLWFRFLKAFNVLDPYCFTYNGVEFPNSLMEKVKKEGSPLAKAYNFSEQKIIYNANKIKPLYDFLIKNYSEQLETYLKEIKVKKELFTILNHPISIDLADKFFKFFAIHRIDLSSDLLLSADLSLVMGHKNEEVSSAHSFREILKQLNSQTGAWNYDTTSEEGYTINLEQKHCNNVKVSDSSDLIRDYSLLLPLYIFKSVNKMDHCSVKITELEKDLKWQVSYA